MKLSISQAFVIITWIAILLAFLRKPLHYLLTTTDGWFFVQGLAVPLKILAAILFDANVQILIQNDSPLFPIGATVGSALVIWVFIIFILPYLFKLSAFFWNYNKP